MGCAMTERELEAEVRDRVVDVLGPGQLSFVYQPVINLLEMRPTSCEALVRWQCADGRALSPFLLLDTLAAANATLFLTQWCLYKAAEAAKALSVIAAIPVSVNVPVRQGVVADLHATWRDACSTRHIAPSTLLWEVDDLGYEELLAEREASEPTTRGSGPALVLDNVHLDWRSLPRLGWQDVVMFKTPRGLMAGLTHSEEARSTLLGLVSLAERNGIELVAKGVEDPVCLSKVIAAGCHGVQGYIFRQPEPLETLMSAIEHRSWADALCE
jgi:EAL domain-containing protein (putative c-di-GMP-specific phosphodiesterase class I)